MSRVTGLFARMPLRWKVVALMLGVAAISLLLIGAGLLLHERDSFERQTAQKLTLLADVIGLNSTAALAFQDPVAAGETLAALASDEHIVAAALYDAQGGLFARYLRGGAELPLPSTAPALDKPTFNNGEASLVRPVTLKGQPLGQVYLLADTSEWTETLWTFVGLVAILFAAVLTVGLFVSMWLQRFVTDPVTALAQAEEKFRTLSETASDAIISSDDRGTIVYVNPATERLFGYSAAELSGGSLTRLMPQRFYGLHQGGFERYLAGGKAHVVGKGSVELAGRRKDGSEFPLELTLGEWRAENQRRFTAVIRDITLRRQTEEHIRSLNRDLESRSEQLEATNKELEAFSYSVSHDLRAPLRAIDGFSRILLDEHSKTLDAGGRDCLERVRRAAQRMGNLIDDLLKLARVTRTEPTREEVDLSAVAEEIAGALQGQEPARDVRFAVSPGLKVVGDARLLRIVLENLLGNAWKFTGNRPDAHIELGVKVNSAPTYFVRDNGAGFDMNYADKLFAPFQRLHTVQEFPGTGIGLATVHRIIRKHGGRIWAEGAVDDGAVFYFTLG